jgi:hypothetical protein
MTNKKTKFSLLLVGMLLTGFLSYAQDATAPEKSVPEKPAPEKQAPEKSLMDQAKEIADKIGFSAGKSTTGEGVKVCEKVYKEIQLCGEKDGMNMKSGWNVTIGTTW